MRRSLAVRLGRNLTLAVLALTAVVVMVLLRVSAIGRDYDQLLSTEVRTALLAREAQVSFKVQVQEWKNVLLRGRDEAALQKYRGQFIAEGVHVRALTDSLEHLVRDSTARGLLRRFRDAHASLGDKYVAAIAAFTADAGRSPYAGDAAVKGMDRPPTAVLDSLVAHVSGVVADRTRGTHLALARSETVLSAIWVCVGLLLVVGGYGMVRGLSRPIVDVARYLDAVRSGPAHQLAQRSDSILHGSLATLPPIALSPLPVTRDDELGLIGEASNAIRMHLEQVTDNLEHAMRMLDAVLRETRARIERVRQGDLLLVSGEVRPGVYGELSDAVTQAVTAVSIPLSSAIGVMEQVADGSLTARMPNTLPGEFDRLARAVNQALDQMSASMRNMRSAAELTRAQATAMASENVALSESTRRHSTDLERVAESLTETAASIERSAASMRALRVDAGIVATSMANGATAVNELATDMADVKRSTDASARVVRTIEEIAFQTNLLALNAAVEAARAGEAGRGFAVVADEVRALAMRAAAASQQTGELIDSSARRAASAASRALTVTSQLALVHTQVDGLSARIVEQAAEVEHEAAAVVRVAGSIGQLRNASNDAAGATAATAEGAQLLVDDANAVLSQIEQFVLDAPATSAYPSTTNRHLSGRAAAATRQPAITAA